jgi:hypothetical protein
MNRYTIAVVLCFRFLTACGGEADLPLEVSDDQVEEDPPAQQGREIPLCDGSPEPGPDLCQELRYGDRGYCNRWVSCDSLND